MRNGRRLRTRSVRISGHAAFTEVSTERSRTVEPGRCAIRCQVGSVCCSVHERLCCSSRRDRAGSLYKYITLSLSPSPPLGRSRNARFSCSFVFVVKPSETRKGFTHMWPYGQRTCQRQQGSCPSASSSSSSMYQRNSGAVSGSTGSPMCSGDCFLPGPFYTQTVPNNYRCKMTTWCGHPPPNFHQYITDTPPRSVVGL